LLPNLETGAHLALLDRERFLDKFRGLTLEHVGGPGAFPDAVTGATVTSRAVAEGVRRAVLSLDSSVVESPARESFWALPDVGTLIACGLVLLAAILLPRLAGAARRVCLLVSLGVLGVWLGRFFSVADLARLGTGGFPGGAAGAGVLLFLVIVLGVTLWRGRVWCTHLCPFGALSELAGWVCGARARTPGPLSRVGRFLPWVILATVCAAVAWTGRLEAAGAEPFAVTFQVLSLKLSPAEAWSAAPAALALAALLVVASLFSARFYCRHLCGAGAVLDLIAETKIKGSDPFIFQEGQEHG
jgi:hypothetical protein